MITHNDSDEDNGNDTDEDEADGDDDDEFELMEPLLREAVSYVRQVFKYFRKSPSKLSQLGVMIEKGEGKQLSLPLNVPTRWNSVLPMVSRYRVVSKYILRCLEMLNDGQLFTRKYDDILKDLSEVLRPIQEAVVELSKHQSNLLIADTTIKYIIESLRALDSPLATKFCEALIIRYSERRLSVEVELLSFLTKKEYNTDSRLREGVKAGHQAKSSHHLQTIVPRSYSRIGTRRSRS